MEDIVSAACAGWLCPEVIEAILTNPEGTGFQFSTEAPTSPRNGQLYVFDSTVVKHFKLDGIDWVLKKETGRVQAVHQKITVNGIPGKITGYYSTAVHNPSSGDLILRKRTYRMSERGSTVFLVHYSLSKRYSHAKTKVEKKRDSELIALKMPMVTTLFEPNPLDYCHRCSVPSEINFSIPNTSKIRTNTKKNLEVTKIHHTQVPSKYNTSNSFDHCLCCPPSDDYSLLNHYPYQKPFNFGLKELSIQNTKIEEDEYSALTDINYPPQHLKVENAVFSEELEYVFDEDDICFLNEYLNSPNDYQSQVGTPFLPASFETVDIDNETVDQFSWDLDISGEEFDGENLLIL